MQNSKILLLAATVGCGVALGLSTVFAGEELGTHDPGVKTRERAQHARIRQGVKSGELTKDEAKGLRKEERGVRREERQFKSDGNLTPAERAKLHSDLNKTSKDIYNEKHDTEKRVPAPSAPPSN